MAAKNKKSAPKKMEAALKTIEYDNNPDRRSHNKLLSNPIFRYFIPFAVLCLILAAHLYLSVYISLYMFVLVTVPGIVVGLAIGLYLYLSLSDKVRKFYYGVLGWKCWAYNPIYYALYIVGYRYVYNKYLARVRDEESYLFSTEGAFLSYVYKVFPLIVLLHFAIIFLRWLIKTIIRLIKKQKAKKAAPAPSEMESAKANKSVRSTDNKGETENHEENEE